MVIFGHILAIPEKVTAATTKNDLFDDPKIAEKTITSAKKYPKMTKTYQKWSFFDDPQLRD